jgi:hypothetical protein
VAEILLEPFNQFQIKSIKRFCFKIQTLEFPKDSSVLAGYIYMLENVFETAKQLDSIFIQNIRIFLIEILKYDVEPNFNPKASFIEIQELCADLLDKIEKNETSGTLLIANIG